MYRRSFLHLFSLSLSPPLSLSLSLSHTQAHIHTHTHTQAHALTLNHWNEDDSRLLCEDGCCLLLPTWGRVSLMTDWTKTQKWFVKMEMTEELSQHSLEFQIVRSLIGVWRFSPLLVWVRPIGNALPETNTSRSFASQPPVEGFVRHFHHASKQHHYPNPCQWHN